MGYEIVEQLHWEVPDVIIYPTGGGTGLVGMWKAFDEMEELGVLLPHSGTFCAGSCFGLTSDAAVDRFEATQDGDGAEHRLRSNRQSFP